MKAPRVLADLRQLREISAARIGLRRAGVSIATDEMLQFDLDHARARDAVHLPFRPQDLARQLHERHLDTLSVHSAAMDRSTYLQRPDLGRRLDEPSRDTLIQFVDAQRATADLVMVVADGLSTRAIHDNALALLDAFLPLAAAHGWQLAPVVIASEARVALADEIGQLLQARLAIILIGERPGLSAADSMGLYLTYTPHIGCSDAQRNCISNIRRGGLGYAQAALQLDNLVSRALRLGLSGVQLKDDGVLLES